MILIDSSIWIHSSHREGEVERSELSALLAEDDAATTEVVIAEVLQGARSEQEFARLQDRLAAMHFYSADRAIWEKAGRLSFELYRRGLPTPLADLVVGMLAVEYDLAVYARDDHFDRVPGLRLHQPRT